MSHYALIKTFIEVDGRFTVKPNKTSETIISAVKRKAAAFNSIFDEVDKFDELTAAKKALEKIGVCRFDYCPYAKVYSGYIYLIAEIETDDKDDKEVTYSDIWDFSEIVLHGGSYATDESTERI